MLLRTMLARAGRRPTITSVMVMVVGCVCMWLWLWCAWQGGAGGHAYEVRATCHLPHSSRRIINIQTDVYIDSSIACPSYIPYSAVLTTDGHSQVFWREDRFSTPRTTHHHNNDNGKETGDFRRLAISTGHNVSNRNNHIVRLCG